ncbi:MAG: hypothetical protein AAGM22_31055, partial [Acidobacteriota bacterium]
PPSGGGVVICGGGKGDGWGSREHQTDPDPPLIGDAVAWRALVARIGAPRGADAAAAHLETLAWLAPVIWPELGAATGGDGTRRLLALGPLD